MSKDGFVNETMFIVALNDKKYKDLNDNLKKFCREIFQREFQDDDIIKAKKPTIRGLKPDVIVSFGNVEKYISIKKGSGNSVHQESFYEFIKFLENENVSSTVINDLKLFHFGDGTIDDTGEIRFSASECKEKYIDEIKNINQYFNSKDLLVKLLDRFLFVGNVTNAYTVDYIYYGTITDGIWASKNSIINYFINNNFRSDAVHIASLTYQVWGRNQDRTAKHPDRRYIMQIKWGQLNNELLIIKSYGETNGYE